MVSICFFLFKDTAPTEIYTYCHTLSLHDALPICLPLTRMPVRVDANTPLVRNATPSNRLVALIRVSQRKSHWMPPHPSKYSMHCPAPEPMSDTCWANSGGGTVVGHTPGGKRRRSPRPSRCVAHSMSRRTAITNVPRVWER